MNKQEYLLTCLSEEAAEITHRISKILRFGAKEVRPKQELNNTELLAGEMNDFEAVVQLCQEAGVIPKKYLCKDQQEAKKAKVKKYMKYSKEQGTLS